MITLGINPSHPFGINSISQLPSSWKIKPQPAQSTTQGVFMLPANSSVSFNSGSKSFSGNIAFGKTFTARGCGGASNPYPNSTNLAEFTLNMPGETVDISGVNGTNALIAIKFKGQTQQNQWNDGAGGNANVTYIANESIMGWAPVPGVYGWQATGCTTSSNPPNPMRNCPAPVNAPSKPQVQSIAQCNIQRSGNVPTGGTVQIIFSGAAS
ncbi:hypothetical protein DVJ77_16325 [Dyella tabacisoli]|uniref:Uncharacterized protein n=2 Tax=Dyella tabacisoli TaxID=2282381 RepID=A0A369UL71_9GAMM|nr:hypothetical protein DVJ77_16325 [Dyella tabacisoli]